MYFLSFAPQTSRGVIPASRATSRKVILGRGRELGADSETALSFPVLLLNFLGAKSLENGHGCGGSFAVPHPRVNLRELEMELGVVRIELGCLLNFAQGRLVAFQSYQTLANSAQREQVPR